MDPLKISLPYQRVLISGGGGYLGSKLAEHLAATQAEVYLLDLHFNEIATNLAAENSAIKLIQTDLTDKKQLEKACHQLNPELIFHFAAAIDRSRDFGIYEKLSNINVMGTLNLLEVVKDVPYKGFFFAGTSEIYGVKNPLPFHEEMLTEAASPYSLTKLQAEALIQTYSAIHNKPWTIFRIFNFYGPGMPENTFIPQLMKACITQQAFHMSMGAQKRDYLHVNEVVSCITSLAANEKSNKEIINICSGNSYSMQEIASYYQKLSENKLTIINDLPYRDNELWDNTGSNKKMLAIIPDFSPLSLFDGLMNPYEKQ